MTHPKFHIYDKAQRWDRDSRFTTTDPKEVTKYLNEHPPRHNYFIFVNESTSGARYNVPVCDGKQWFKYHQQRRAK